MKVICVSHKLFDIGDLPYGPNDPQIGDICEVISVCSGWNYNGLETPCYELAGYNDWVYDQRNFATLPDQPAEVIEEQSVNLQPA